MKALLAIPILVAGGCATAFGTGPFQVPVTSEPSGAEVVYETNVIGRTPCSLLMRSTRSRSFTVRTAGYHPREVFPAEVSNGSLVLGGVLLFGPFELISAAANNSWSGLSETGIHVTLAPIGTAPLPPLRFDPPKTKTGPFANDLSTIGM
jgi:hypothetical protein